MAKLFGGPRFAQAGETFPGNAQEMLKAPLLAEIKNLPDEVVLTEGAEAIAERLAMAHSLTAPRLLEKQISIDDTPIEVTNPVGQKTSGTRVRYFIPFEGRGDLLMYGSRGADASAFRNADVEGNEIILTFESTRNDPAEIRSLFNDHLKRIREGIQSLDHALRTYSKDIKVEARTQVQARINLLTQQDWEKALGYPRKQNRPTEMS